MTTRPPSTRYVQATALVLFVAMACIGLVSCRPTTGAAGIEGRPLARAIGNAVSTSPIASAGTTTPGDPTAAGSAAPPPTSAAAPPTSTPMNRPVASGELVFGLGPVLDTAATAPVADQLGMLSTWYNSPNDLGFLRAWRNDLIPSVYAGGRAIHLIVWLGGAGQSTTVETRHGAACGRDYPILPAFLQDARELARIFAGAADGPPLYITLFTELQTYPCSANVWAPSPEVTNYYRALKDAYTAAKDIFHGAAPNSLVSLGWGGWQSRWDDAGAGGGRSLVTHFADVLRASDFQSFQAMGSDSNAGDILEMTKLLGRYGPVMLAHFKSDLQATWTSDMRTTFTDDRVDQLTEAGLFAVSFMDQDNIGASPTALQLTRDTIERYGTTEPG